MVYKTMSDEQLIEHTRSGDSRAYDAFFKRHWNWVEKHCYGLLKHQEDAEDASIKTFCKFLGWIMTPRWRPKAKPTTNLWLIAVSVCSDMIDQRKTRIARSLDELIESGLEVADPRLELSLDDLGALTWEIANVKATDIEFMTLFDRVRYILDQLPEEDREILLLKYVDEFSTQEISQILGISPKTVYSRIHSAKKRFLKKALEIFQEWAQKELKTRQRHGNEQTEQPRKNTNQKDNAGQDSSVDDGSEAN